MKRNFRNIKIIDLVQEFRLPVIISLLATIVWLSGDPLNHLLRYESVAVSQGEYWRLITANFTHSNGWHLLLNMAGLWIMDFIFQRDLALSRRAALILFCMFGNVWLLHLLFHLKWYVGLSGALHGYLAGCALLSWNRARLNNFLILLGVTGKVLLESNYEINQGTAALIGANVVEEAHAMGTLSAFAFFALFYVYRHIFIKHSSNR